MTEPIQFSGERSSNKYRQQINQQEPIALRTFTPSQAVISKSAGCYHWTPEGRRLYDYSSGVLVANLGHNPTRWVQKMLGYLGWDPAELSQQQGKGYFPSVPLSAYNAITELEAQANERLLANLHQSPGSGRLQQVMWAASGSEAIQKALWACLHAEESRDIILATRHGFHGKKGLAGAVTGSETDRDRDPRVKFISFPMHEVADFSQYDQPWDPTAMEKELETLWREYGHRINCLITEPYLGGGGSYHPPKAYFQVLQKFCREHDILFILDEVQANFGRTGCMYAFETYGVEPDFVCLGKGLGNGVPVAATVGRADIFASLKYGEGSDTWSANPLSCAAVLATLDEFEASDVLGHAARISEIFKQGLTRLKETGVIARVRGEGMVFGIDCASLGDLSAKEVAIQVVETCYLGNAAGEGIHFLGPLAGTVLRVSPPLTMTEQEARDSLDLLSQLVGSVAQQFSDVKTGTA